MVRLDMGISQLKLRRRQFQGQFVHPGFHFLRGFGIGIIRRDSSKHHERRILFPAFYEIFSVGVQPFSLSLEEKRSVLLFHG